MISKDSTTDEKFTSFLKSMNLRKTPERFEILHAVLDIKGHFDVESLYANLENKSYHVSRTTVYNTLELLCQCGIVRKLLFDTHQARYELAELTHSHLICTQCGDIREIDLEATDASLSRMDFNGFVPAYVSTCIYGLCNACREKALNPECSDS